MTRAFLGAAAAAGLVSEVRRLLVGERPILVAIDGRSGAGKSTVARLIADELEAALVVADDFYSGGNDCDWLALPTEDRVDRVIDWQRLRRDALEPLLRGEQARWRPLDFDPGVGWIGWKEEEVTVEPADVIIVEGAYSARPELDDILHLKVLVEAPDAVRRERVVAREGEAFSTRWHELWDDAEELYFESVRPRTDFDVIVACAGATRPQRLLRGAP